MDGTWVLGDNAYFTNDGNEMPLDECDHIWIGGVFTVQELPPTQKSAS